MLESRKETAVITNPVPKPVFEYAYGNASTPAPIADINKDSKY